MSLRRKFFSILFVAFFVFTPITTRAEAQNLGFVETNIWYSKDPFEEKDKIEVYTLVFNPSNNKFKGTVAFFDKKTLLGKKEFTVAPTSAEAVSIDWVVTLGGHEIFAKIENPRFETKPGVYEEVYLASDETERSVRTVAKKIPDVGEVKNKIEEAVEASEDQLIQTQNKISESLPEAVRVPINTVGGVLEHTRLSTLDIILEEKKETRAELDMLSANTSKEGATEKSDSKDEVDDLVKEQESASKNITSSVEAPLKYVWLFFLAIVSYIFQYKVIFYVFLLLALIGIIRLVFKLFR